MIKIQGNLLKCLVGLGPRYRTTPLLNAVYMSKVSSIIDMGNISLLNQIMRISSAARTCNNIMLQKDSACPKTLINRVKQICSDNNLNFVDVVTSPEQIRHTKSKILPHVKDGQDCMIDSIRLLLNCKTPSVIYLTCYVIMCFIVQFYCVCFILLHWRLNKYYYYYYYYYCNSNSECNFMKYCNYDDNNLMYYNINAFVYLEQNVVPAKLQVELCVIRLVKIVWSTCQTSKDLNMLRLPHVPCVPY